MSYLSQFIGGYSFSGEFNKTKYTILRCRIFNALSPVLLPAPKTAWTIHGLLL
ncbi:MAG: hypothetical protein KDK38_07910 [Leptospiraceae bacterium]|nr:hypothetical protein [Leptospiraceae bacterium]